MPRPKAVPSEKGLTLVMSEETATVEVAPELKELGDKIADLTLKQAIELSDYLKDEHSIEPAAGGAVVMAAGGGGGAAEEEEQTEFDVVLTGFGDKKLNVVKEVKAAEASKQSATLHSDQVVIVAEADRVAAEKQTHATKMLAEAKVADEAASGLAQANVQEAQAVSLEKEGHAEASVLQRKAEAEAKGLEAKAVAIEKHGTAEAEVMRVKYSSEANGIQEKAESMKLFDSVGKEHEEFKLRLNKDKDIEIAAIAAQQDIAEAQSRIVGEALKSARIDIVGGETEFFDKIIDSIKGGKSVDRFVNNSGVLTDMKNSFFNGNPDYFRDKMDELVTQFNLSTDDVKDLSIAALIARMLGLTKSEGIRYELQRLLGIAADAGISADRASSLGLGSGKKSKSDRPASSGENSTSSVLFLACATAATALSNTCSGVIRSLSCI